MAEVPETFSIVDGKVIWQKVYDTTKNLEELETTIINDGQFSDILVKDGIITCRFDRKKATPKEYGIKSYSSYVGCNDISGFVTIQVKDGKYRVTIDNIILTEKFTDALYKEGTTHTFETFALNNKGEYSKPFSKMYQNAEFYNAVFEKLLNFQDKSYLNDDNW